MSFFRQRRLSKQMPALRHASSDHDLCHAGKSGKLRYLKRNVVPAGGFDLGSQLLCQTDMPPKLASSSSSIFWDWEVSTYSAVNSPLKASAIRAAARIMVPLAGEEDDKLKYAFPGAIYNFLPFLFISSEAAIISIIRSNTSPASFNKA